MPALYLEALTVPGAQEMCGYDGGQQPYLKILLPDGQEENHKILLSDRQYASDGSSDVSHGSASDGQEDRYYNRHDKYFNITKLLATRLTCCTV